MTSVVEMASAFELWRGMSDGGVGRNDIEACISRVVTRGGNIKDLIVIWAIIRDIELTELLSVHTSSHIYDARSFA